MSHVTSTYTETATVAKLNGKYYTGNSDWSCHIDHALVMTGSVRAMIKRDYAEAEFVTVTRKTETVITMKEETK